MWRKSALSSKLIFASSATTSPFFRTTSGLISAERAVLLHEELVEAGHQLHELADGLLAVLLEAEAEGELARLVGDEADDRVDVDREDLLGGLGGDLLDLHAPLGRRHEGDAPPVAVDDRAEVELAHHVEPLLDVEPPHLLPLGARLVRDELHAEDLLGELARLGGAPLGDLDAAALAAAAGVDLRLDDDDRAPRLGDELLRARPRPRRR